MNLEIILSMAKPYIKDGAITYNAFDKLFSILSRREQYQVSELLIANGIDLVDEHIDENSLVLDIDCEDHALDDFDDDNFEILYDKTLFQDKTPSDSYYHRLSTNANIQQSNEILCTLIQQGNHQSAQDLCIKNKRLVDKYVLAYEKRYGNRLDFEDLEQAGFIGLIRAAQKFRIQQGTAFTTYAVYWIKQSILREIMDNGYAIRIPVHMMERINKVAMMTNRLISIGTPLSDRIPIIANELNITEADVRECLVLKANYLTYTSLDAPVGEDQDTELSELIPIDDEETVEQIVFNNALHHELEAVLSTLSPKEQEILKLRFGWNNNQTKTLEEVGSIYGLTRERIRQLEQKALRRLRHYTRSRRLRAFWED